MTDPEFLLPLLDAGWEVHIPMHRGTGLSTPLTCDALAFEEPPPASDPGPMPTSADELLDHPEFRAHAEATEACIDELEATWGRDGLAGFTSWEAARDIGHLIARERGTGNEPVMIFGVSYGTWLAQRYLQYFPDQPDGVVLDGVFDLRSDILRSDIYTRELLDRTLAVCDADPTCAAAFDHTPAADVHARVRDALDAGSCRPLAEAGIDAATFDEILALMLVEGTPELVAAIIQRVDHCEREPMELFAEFSAFELGLADGDEAFDEPSSSSGWHGWRGCDDDDDDGGEYDDDLAYGDRESDWRDGEWLGDDWRSDDDGDAWLGDDEAWDDEGFWPSDDGAPGFEDEDPLAFENPVLFSVLTHLDLINDAVSMAEPPRSVASYPPSLDGLLETYEKRGIAALDGLFLLAEHTLWPEVRIDAHVVRTMPEVDVPILMLNGGLDAATVPRWGELAAAHFDGPSQHSVWFPTAGHGTIDWTFTRDGANCSFDLIQAFMSHPDATALDTSCVDEVLGPDYAADAPETQEMAEVFFGEPTLFSE